MCGVPGAHPGAVPAAGQRGPVARGLRQVRDVRLRAAEHLLPARPQTVLQTGLRGVSDNIWFKLLFPVSQATQVLISITIMNASINLINARTSR